VVVFSKKTRRLEMNSGTLIFRRVPKAKRWWFGTGGLGLEALKFIFTSFLALELLASQAPAAEDLQVDLVPLGLSARNQSPIPVEVRFKWNSDRILEGRLEMEFHEGNRVLGRYRSGDLALTGGDQTFRMLLPPSLAPYSDSQVEVQMKFVTAGNTMEIDPSAFSTPTASERSLVVGLCNSAIAGGELSPDLARNLMFERFAPPSDNASERLMRTSVVRLTPEDLPSQPLAYTPFDIVVLTDEAFKEASDRQLQALVRWVKGGGSVCVFVAGGLQAHHLKFLNQLDESASDGPRFLCDSAGNLLPARKDMLCLHSGLGRSVIVAGKNPSESISNVVSWRTMAAFLWKMRRSQALTIANSGQWDPIEITVANYNLTGRPQSFQGNRQPFIQQQSYWIQPTKLGAELMGRLMPEKVRLIPYSALIGMLGLFLLMIGPADYFVLGYFRRRRLTWVLFPVTSIVFTAATVLMANHYLGLRDQRRSLIVVDLAGDGTALRWNRYELVFAARDKHSVTELKDALWAPLDAGAGIPGFIQMTPGMPNYNQVGIVPGSQGTPYYSSYPGYGYPGGDNRRDSDPPLYDGTLPVHFQTSEAIHQWQPELNRVFSFEPPPVPLFPNWRAIEGAWPNLDNIRAQLSGIKPFHGDVYGIFGRVTRVAAPGSMGILPAPLLDELCAGDFRGLFSLVSQISPTGGGNFEDVQAMDPDAHDTALAIITQSGDDIVVYRRFFYGN
jgi:hypothetical protein